MKKFILLFIAFLLFATAFAQHSIMGVSSEQKSKHLPLYTKIGKREIYHLYINDTTVNYTGKQRPAMAINGSIPAPAL